MEVKKCDRCNAYFDKNEHPCIYRIIKKVKHETTTLDLCDNCAFKLSQFIREFN